MTRKLKSILTKADTDLLLDVFKTVFVTKTEFEEFRIEAATKNDLKNVKNEVLNVLDTVLKEVVAMRQEQTIIVHRISEHTDRISALEKIHPRGQHITL